MNLCKLLNICGIVWQVIPQTDDSFGPRLCFDPSALNHSLYVCGRIHIFRSMIALGNIRGYIHLLVIVVAVSAQTSIHRLQQRFDEARTDRVGP